MTMQYHNIYGLSTLPIQTCQYVYVCMTDTWASRTTSGLALVKGKVISISASVVPTQPYSNQTLCCSTPPDCCNPTPTTQPLGCAPTTSTCPTDPALKYKMNVFYVEIDDSQFINDPATGLPYVPVCTDFVEIAPYACVWDKIISALIP